MTKLDLVYTQVESLSGPIHTYRVADHVRARRTRAVIVGELQPILAWCQVEFGPARTAPWGATGMRWYYSSRRLSFGFFHPEDAFSFKLRWC